jgi:hypothetical protein
MELLKKYIKQPGNSILESVIALSIISICVFISLLIYTSVYTPKTAPKFYKFKNRNSELFFMMHFENDSISTANGDFQVSEEIINSKLKKVAIQVTDSSHLKIKKSYYIPTNDEK